MTAEESSNAAKAAIQDAIRRPAQKPKLSCFVYVLCLMSVLGGFQCGYNTGIISSAMLHAVNNESIRPVSHLWAELIVAGMPIAAAIGALFAGKLSDTFGRRRVILLSTIVFGCGSFVCASAVHKLLLFAGRILLGLALGLASCVVPVFLGECAPTHVRGQMLSAFNIFLCFGQMFANVVAGCVSYVEPDTIGWRLMFGFAAIPALIQAIGFLFLPESPRWLFVNGEKKKSRHVLNQIYAHASEWVDFELAEISAVHAQEVESRERSGRAGQATIVAVLKTPHVRKALLIGCSLVVFQQLSGIDTIMYYTGPLLKSAGIRDNHTTIWLSLGTSFVNFFGTVLPFFVIDRFGRRCVLLVSTAATVVALLLLGSAFLVVNLDTCATVSIDEMRNLTHVDAPFDESTPHFAHCLAKSNCDFCVTDDKCGFCSPTGGDVGVCLPLDLENPERSATGFCSSAANFSADTNVTFAFAEVTCKTKYTALPLALIVVYLLVFALGLSTIPWVANAEFYPLWARGTCVSVATCAIWSANALISLTFLTFASTISRFGTFYLYAAITSVALWVFWRFVPDTAGYSLDEVELLFMTPLQRERHLKALHTQMAAARIPDDSSAEISYKELESTEETSSNRA